MSCRPNIIRPGETTYVYCDTSYSGDTVVNLIGVPHITIKDASSADDIRYDVSEITFETNAIFNIKGNGTVTNNGESTSSLIYVAILLFDKDGNYYATLFTSISDDLEVGASTTFSASSLELMSHDDFTISDIGSYQTYAYEYEYIF